MLRKRSRTVQEQSKMQVLGDLSSSSCSDAAIEQKARTSSFFSVPGLLVSFTGKGRSWDCNRVGLGLVDSLRDENKNILLGSQMRLINNTNTKNYFNFVGDEHKEPNGLTFSQFCSSKMELDELGKIDSCSSDPIQQTLKPNFDISSVDLIHGYMGSLSESEDYTCIISHGPNPKTTHIFGDCILESCMIESQNSKEEREGGGSHWIIKSSANSPPLPSSDFLNFCCYCSKKLEEGRDIYMYRGEKAFCSCNCRDKAMLIDEELKMEKQASNSCDSPSSSSFHEELFMEGMSVTS